MSLTDYYCDVKNLVVVFLLALSFLAPAPVLAQTEAPKLRLPLTIHPVRYSADLRMTPGEDRFRGSITIELEISQPVSTIWIHGKSLTFEKATLRVGTTDTPAQATPSTNDLLPSLRAALFLRAHATLRIDYSGEVSRSLTDGAFQQQQGNDWYIFTKFEPVTARRVFPCFDEPSFKVPWQLTLHVPKDLKAFSNTLAVSEKDESDG